MYFPDLSKYNYHFVETNRINVGWLSSQYPFPKGTVDSITLLRLKEYPIINKCRGFHICEFCNSANGNGEIEVTGSHRDVFASPAMLIHYIEEHGYRPPDVFLKAVNGEPYEPFHKSTFKRAPEVDGINEWTSAAGDIIREEIDKEIIESILSLNK